MYFTPISFVDVWEFVPSLQQRVRFFPKTDGQRLWRIRWAKEEGGDTYVAAAETRRWPELRTFLARIGRLGGTSPPVEFGAISLEMLMPDTALSWSRPEPSEYGEAQLAVRTNPNAMMYAGNEAMHLLPGALTMVARGVHRSAVNLGFYPRIHLIVEFRRKADAVFEEIPIDTPTDEAERP
jgi:hypothetical protein